MNKTVARLWLLVIGVPILLTLTNAGFTAREIIFFTGRTNSNRRFSALPSSVRRSFITSTKVAIDPGGGGFKLSERWVPGL